MLILSKLSETEKNPQFKHSGPNYDCLTISRQSIPCRFTVSFCNEVWKALKAPQYVNCYWYNDSLVLVASTSGYWVSISNSTKNRDKNTYKCRIYLRSRVVFEALEAKWELSSETGRLYSGGKFVKADIQGTPAVIISRTEDDYYRTDEKSADE